MDRVLFRISCRLPLQADLVLSLVSSIRSRVSASRNIVSGGFTTGLALAYCLTLDYLAVGVVILISIAIAAGVVFLLALIGILWTLFTRRDDKLGKFEGAEDDDDDSTHHRPSSLLDHINAATRNTILGTSSPFGFGREKDEALTTKGAMASDLDPFAADGSNYLRAETPSDAHAGILATEETSRPAHARYSFDGTGEGELALTAGTEVEVLDDRDAAYV